MKLSLLSMLTLWFAAVAGSLHAQQEVDIELSEVPANVIQTAQSAKPGIKLTEAERISEKGKISYELEGNLNREEFEFLISEEGTLIEMELEDD